jgi:hypothetical protein
MRWVARIIVALLAGVGLSVAGVWVILRIASALVGQPAVAGRGGLPWVGVFALGLLMLLGASWANRRDA